MSQMMNLVQMMKNGDITGDDVIYFEDMFQPGFESLGYIMNQIPYNQVPRIFVRCLAQAIDPDDFVHVWGMAGWMSTYEKMVNHFVTGVLATNEEMVAHMRIAGWTAPIYNISGLAFGKTEVLERIGGKQNIKSFALRPRRVGFAARFDQEKQPDFYMDLKNVDHVVFGIAETMTIDLLDKLSGKSKRIFNKYIDHDRKAHADTWDFRESSTRYTELDLIQPQETLNLEIGRGCRFKCAFCNSCNSCISCSYLLLINSITSTIATAAIDAFSSKSCPTLLKDDTTPGWVDNATPG
jgi:hypothetical protein